MYEDPDKLNHALAQAGDAKLVAINRNVIYPLLDRKIEECLAALCDTFKTKGVFASEKIAYIAVCRDLKQDLDAVARRGEAANKVIQLHNKETL